MQDWIQNLIEDVSAIVTEKVYNSNQELIEGYFEVGQRILEDFNVEDREKIYGDKVVATIAKSSKIGLRKLYTIIQSAKKYKTLPDLPKNITWSKFVKEYVTEKKDEPVYPALPNKNYLKEVISHNLDFLVDNLSQNKKGVTMFLPYDYIDTDLTKYL